MLGTILVVIWILSIIPNIGVIRGFRIYLVTEELEPDYPLLQVIAIFIGPFAILLLHLVHRRDYKRLGIRLIEFRPMKSFKIKLSQKEFLNSVQEYYYSSGKRGLRKVTSII